MDNTGYHLVVPAATAADIYALAKARRYAAAREWDYAEILDAQQALDVAFEAMPMSFEQAQMRDDH